ncbi:hypothetical protein CEE36_11320 [candidate division TA06 bacterium B3_TA06]|uniref:Uncharacterized protein n=1 Tax=candidate division TA06 bacterium B3_TA06 TaxID=2012487 RepID=A0A532UPK8_UNCT6|nr:MAG: hypothetical protein CEE36_11320 [candidate division TA06 bacterium B3_TA06]
MVKVKPESEIKKNYEDSTALVPARFEAGVKGATWQAEALEGQDLYEEQMRKDEILKRRASGIEKVSDEAWRKNTVDKGRNIIGARMKAASGKQVAGFRPYREALLTVELLPKTADPMQNLINRAGAVVMAMVNKKAELTA